MTFCTYLTTYHGNKMPIFYIGRSTVERVKQGYRGSVSSRLYKSIWIKELNDCPHLFSTKILTLHSTKQEAAEQEEWFHKSLQVHKNTLYINQATGAGTFLADTAGEKNFWYGKDRSGKRNPMYGRKHSDGTKERMSKSGKGKHSQPKTDAFKETMRRHYAGKTYEERFGAEYAKQIKAKMSKPKSEEHIKKQKENPYNANRPKYPCPHCQKIVSASNLSRWHGDNCILVISRETL